MLLKLGIWQGVPEKPLHEVAEVKPGMQWTGNLMILEISDKEGYREGTEPAQRREMCVKKQTGKG